MFAMTTYSLHPIAESGMQLGKKKGEMLGIQNASPDLPLSGFLAVLEERLEVVGRFRSEKVVLWGSSLILDNK